MTTMPLRKRTRRDTPRAIVALSEGVRIELFES